MYNLKVKYYENGTIQVTTFDNAIETGRKTEKHSLGEDIEINKLKKRYEKLMKDLFETQDSYKENEIELEMLSIENLLARYGEKPIKEIKEKTIDNSVENLNRSMRRTKQKIIDYGRNNIWEWFYTFTFSPDMVKSRSDFDDLSKKIRKWLNNKIQRGSPGAKYLMVPELHKDGENWHFHMLGSGFNFNYEKGINPHTGKVIKDKKGRIVYNVTDYTLGHTTATRIGNTKKAVSYITKYITKELVEDLIGRQKYYKSNNCTLPEERQFYVSKEEIEEILKEIAESNGLGITYRKQIIVNNDFYDNIITYVEME